MAKRDRKTKPPLGDWHLWSEVARTVSPLRPGAKLPPVPDAAPVRDGPVAAAKGKSSVATPMHQHKAITPLGRGVQKASPDRDIEPRIRRRLMRGQLPIDGTIDLHGMRQSEAHTALLRFVAARYARGDRTLLVITGKGLKKTGYGAIEQKGVLRHMLPIWLRDPAMAPMIAGWEISAQAHGGEGAYYVRLKRVGK
ncbi:Smr/MutS family protein [Mariluticola halotolerans]|uniref:Smr/MutS family protein n=1 Tax=Mariluticola halotolerans TaxID=2909283 RepID=UPI0026E29D0B|nr:Smr/MutS family protein [Mariluticola halotolerans]UJQ93470.1 Smr/MutS family protein [Mariluticola halotolerans]